MVCVDIAFAAGGSRFPGLFDVEKDAVFDLILDARMAYCTTTQRNLLITSKKILHFYPACIKSPQFFNLRPLRRHH
jgi:hypothetical protein